MRKTAVLLPTLICLFISIDGLAQNDFNCKEHPLFSIMPDHSVVNCDRKEFDKVEFYRKEKNGASAEFEKQGEILSVEYKYNKDWNQRPSTTQIYQNYVNAIQKNNGQILSNGSSLYASLKKGGDTYWIKVNSDGSGNYRLITLKEAAMKQDIVMTANDIKKNIDQDGKVAFYNIYFDTDEAKLKTESSPALAEIAKFLKDNPGFVFYVVGHTDNTGAYDHNISLSKGRALAVVAELTTKYGIAKTQLEGQGVGPLAPVAGNSTNEGKAKNRRVELVRKN